VKNERIRLNMTKARNEQLKKEIGELTAGLKEAVALREKGAAAAAGEEKSLAQALANVKNAIIILSKHSSLLQVNAMAT